MNRRDFLKGAAALLTVAVPGMSAAQAATSKALVQLINFHCSRCFAVNDQHARIAQAAAEAAVDYRAAPIAWGEQSMWPSRMYYSLRDLYPGSEHAARDAIFEGIHKEGQRFETLDQLVVFLERFEVLKSAQALHQGFNLDTLRAHAESDAPLAAEIRAIRLLEQSAAEEVPVFVWVENGLMTQVISPAQAAEPGALVQRVMGQLRS